MFKSRTQVGQFFRKCLQSCTSIEWAQRTRHWVTKLNPPINPPPLIKTQFSTYLLWIINKKLTITIKPLCKFFLLWLFTINSSCVYSFTIKKWIYYCTVLIILILTGIDLDFLVSVSHCISRMTLSSKRGHLCVA